MWKMGVPTLAALSMFFVSASGSGAPISGAAVRPSIDTSPIEFVRRGHGHGHHGGRRAYGHQVYHGHRRNHSYGGRHSRGYPHWGYRPGIVIRFGQH